MNPHLLLQLHPCRSNPVPPQTSSACTHTSCHTLLWKHRWQFLLSLLIHFLLVTFRTDVQLKQTTISESEWTLWRGADTEARPCLRAVCCVTWKELPLGCRNLPAPTAVWMESPFQGWDTFSLLCFLSTYSPSSPSASLPRSLKYRPSFPALMPTFLSDCSFSSPAWQGIPEL